ncbi:MAG: Fic family protein [Steroidobacteraceae bacterium]
MKRGSTGTYETTVTAGESVQAFTPFPLPPEPELQLVGPLQIQLEQATLACGRLDGISGLLPDPELFLYAYVRREAVLSSQIEGTQSSLSDLLLFELDELPGVPFDDVVEVSSYVAALEHGMKRLSEGFPISGRLLREVHAVLLARGRGANKLPGEFRRTQNWIGGTRPGTARFVPPVPAALPQCISDLEKYLHAADRQPTLVTAALAHVQFETVHPFLDGNGRVGRLMISLILHESGVLRQPLLYLSLFLKQHRDEYYWHLANVRATGDWEHWLQYFLEGVAQTATEAVDTAHRLLKIFREDEIQTTSVKRNRESVRQVFEAMRARPIANIGILARRTGLTFATVAKGVNSLVELGILKELTGGKRGRVFAYDRYVQVLNEGAEPLSSAKQKRNREIS